MNEQELENKIIDLDLWSTIKEKVEIEYHSFGMIFDFIKKQYPELLEGWDLKRLKKILVKKNFKTDFKKYNCQNNFWKLQYRYSEEELKKIALDSQKETIKKRKEKQKNGNPYNPKQGLDYWILQGFSKEEAAEKSRNFKRENSPRCVEFYLKKGLIESKAQEIIKNNAIQAAIKSLKFCNNTSIEKTVSKFLMENNFLFSPQFRLNSNFSHRNYFVYDFYLKNENILIECNGTYWHCDPRFFQENDEVSFRGKKFSVREIWNFDKLKKENAENFGYKVLTLWEKELNQSNEKTKEYIINELDRVIKS